MKLSELTPDLKNANKGTKRGRQAVARSLIDYGAGRSIVIDRDDRIIGGNKTVEQASAAGIREVIVIESDGSKLIAVKRTDLSLDDPKARALAVADNRVGELGLEWDPGVLAELSTLDLEPYFTRDELTALKVLPVDDLAATDQSGALESTYSVLVSLPDEASQLALLERLTGEGFECRSLIA
jgi:hypothetical protein